VGERGVKTLRRSRDGGDVGKGVEGSRHDGRGAVMAVRSGVGSWCV